jgi:hypothetical protein
MRTILSIIAILGLIAVVAVPGLAGAQGEDKQLSAAEVKTMLSNMGYTLKDLNTEAGKEKVEFMIQRDGFDVYVAAEVSPSKRYVWLTVFLGEVKEFSNFDERAAKLLHQNFKVQPTMFYTTDKGNFMMAIATDNRNLNAAALRFRIDKLVADCTSTNEFWKK